MLKTVGNKQPSMEVKRLCAEHDNYPEKASLLDVALVKSFNDQYIWNSLKSLNTFFLFQTIISQFINLPGDCQGRKINRPENMVIQNWKLDCYSIFQN